MICGKDLERLGEKMLPREWSEDNPQLDGKNYKGDEGDCTFLLARLMLASQGKPGRITTR